MGSTGVVLAVVGTAAALTIGGYIGLSQPEDDAEFRRQAETIATAVSWPRQRSAAGFTRAVLATNAGRSGGVTVVESTELDAESPGDPLARLVLRFHRDAAQGKLHTTDPVTVCYELLFDAHGAVGPPENVDCPSHTPITPRPVPVLGEPAFDQALERLLGELPDSPTVDEVVRRLLRHDLYHPDPMTEDIPRPDPEDPVLDVQVDGDDAAVSFHRAAPGTPVCVLAARVDGRAAVWHPAGAGYHRRTACTATAAMAGEGR